MQWRKIQVSLKIIAGPVIFVYLLAVLTARWGSVAGCSRLACDPAAVDSTARCGLSQSARVWLQAIPLPHTHAHTHRITLVSQSHCDGTEPPLCLQTKVKAAWCHTFPPNRPPAQSQALKWHHEAPESTSVHFHESPDKSFILLTPLPLGRHYCTFNTQEEIRVSLQQQQREMDHNALQLQDRLHSKWGVQLLIRSYTPMCGFPVVRKYFYFT